MANKKLNEKKIEVEIDNFVDFLSGAIKDFLYAFLNRADKKEMATRKEIKGFKKIFDKIMSIKHG